MAHAFTSENFEKEVLGSEGIVLVDFWAPWCGPCKIIGPIIEELAGEYEGKGAKIGKVNVDEQPALAQQFGIMSIPTLVLFKAGQPVKQWVGLQSKETLAAALDEAAA